MIPPREPAVPGRDWTCDDDGRSNSSPAFLATVEAVERIIRADAYKLIAGHADQTAALIVAHLAHQRGLAPTGRDTDRRATTWAAPFERAVRHENGYIQRDGEGGAQVDDLIRICRGISDPGNHGDGCVIVRRPVAFPWTVES